VNVAQGVDRFRTKHEHHPRVVKHTATIDL
jgi:hypothetical protein